jgi:PAS domain S-box-containing protein
VRNGDASLTRSVSIAARALTAAVLLLPPSIYLVTSYQHEAGVLEAEAEINARLVTRIVSANPDLWQYEQIRISEYLSRRPGTGEPERRRVLDARGRVVAESADPLPGPWLTKSVPLLDSGVQVGMLQVSRSVQPLLLRSAVLAVALLALGAASYRAVRTVPLRFIRRSQDALRRERDTAQRYLDVAGVAFLIVDEGGRVALVNRKGCEILGRPESEVLGHEWLAAFVDPADGPRVAAETSAARTTDDVVPLEYSVVRPDGERRLISWYLTPLRDDEGRRAGVLASGVDVTVQAQLEEQLRRAHRLEAIGRLASGVAHDFNNVLSVIKGKAVLLRRQVEEQDPRRRYVDDILASVDRAASLTGNLLTFGRREVLRPEAMDLVEFLRRFERSLRGLVRDGVELRFALPPDPLPVVGEPLQLERVLMNLVTNAQDAMPEGGRVVVSASRTALDARGAAAAGVEAPGRYAELSVTDAGTGIPPEAQASIFEPFFTTKDVGKGTGLGLSICYAIAKQHHGTIRVESEPGKGSTFTVLLPIAERRAGTSAASDGAGAEPRAGG